MDINQDIKNDFEDINQEINKQKQIDINKITNVSINEIIKYDLLNESNDVINELDEVGTLENKPEEQQIEPITPKKTFWDKIAIIFGYGK